MTLTGQTVGYGMRDEDTEILRQSGLCRLKQLLIYGKGCYSATGSAAVKTRIYFAPNKRIQIISNWNLIIEAINKWNMFIKDASGKYLAVLMHIVGTSLLPIHREVTGSIPAVGAFFRSPI
ncbi:hypothetical protein DPMN_067657 [Dreissena polymorpha]|uniref:Uncharacterized protein n=1 Tax=Dreissena polymorpha TaxID=45954 RepID=A0A9D4BVZ8_DREPO|nr:hypothetical protein DPMN_067657 [Dreissena polymorpha]